MPSWQDFKTIGKGFYSAESYRSVMNDTTRSVWHMIVVQLIFLYVLLSIGFVGFGLYFRMTELPPLIAAFPNIEIVKGIAKADASPVVLRSKGGEFAVLIDTRQGFEKFLDDRYKDYNLILTRDALVEKKSHHENDISSFKEINYMQVDHRYIDVLYFTFLLIMPCVMVFATPFVALGLGFGIWRFLLASLVAGLLIAVLTEPIVGKKILLKQGLRAGLLLLFPSLLIISILDQIFHFRDTTWGVSPFVDFLLAALIALRLIYLHPSKKDIR